MRRHTSVRQIIGGTASADSSRGMNTANATTVVHSPGFSDGRLRNVQGAHDLSGHLEHLLTFFPGDVGIELDTQGRRQHLRGQVFRVFSRLLVGFSVRMVFGQIPVRAAVGGDRQPDRRGDQAIPLIRFRPRHDTEGDFTRIQQLLAALARNDFAIGRENRRHADEVTIGDTGTAQRLLEGGQLFACGRRLLWSETCA